MIELTEEQVQVLSEPHSSPPQLLNPRTKEAFVLLRVEEYKQLTTPPYDDSPWTQDKLRAVATATADTAGRDAETDDAHREVHRKEANFHDEWATSTPLEKISVREAFEAPTAPENRFILKMMGPLAGKSVLDVGTGLGESAVYFALQGAKVTATDLSPQMVDTAVRLGKLHNVEIDGVVTAGESLNVPEASYDFVYVANTIHHVTNKRSLYEQVKKALKPSGKFFSWDPLAYNPVINVYRKMASGVRTEDEFPLSFNDVKLAGEFFANVGHREFQIATLSIFLKYYLIDRVHPNQDRYWKRILRETNRSLWWWQPLRAADVLLTRLPLVRRLAWNMVMWGER